MAIRHCEQCGAEVPENSAFCEACGARLKDSPAPDPGRPGGMKISNSLIIGIVAVIIIAIIAVVVMTSPTAPPQSPIPPATTSPPATTQPATSILTTTPTTRIPTTAMTTRIPTTTPAPPSKSITYEDLGTVWNVKEYGPLGNYDGTWTRRTGTNTFDAKWGSITDVIDITSIKGNTVTLHRRGNNGDYSGTISSDKTQIIGTASWYPPEQIWMVTIVR